MNNTVKKNKENIFSCAPDLELYHQNDWIRKSNVNFIVDVTQSLN